MATKADFLTEATGEGLVYDLRQRYANIVGDHLEDIARARKAEDFYSYAKNLKDLFTIVQHKFKKKEQKVKKYNELLKQVLELANKNRAVWNRQSIDPEVSQKIEDALRNIEMFLYEEMDEGGVFGEKSEIPHL
jgi:light-regulated signal transduction histidine kinase (bacteriophytochrome)